MPNASWRTSGKYSSRLWKRGSRNRSQTYIPKPGLCWNALSARKIAAFRDRSARLLSTSSSSEEISIISPASRASTLMSRACWRARFHVRFMLSGQALDTILYLARRF